MIIMMIFNMLSSYFPKFSFHYFEDYLMKKLTLGYGSKKRKRKKTSKENGKKERKREKRLPLPIVILVP